MANETIIRNGLKVKEGTLTIGGLVTGGGVEYLTIDTTTGVISKTASAGSSYTDENAQDAVGNILTNSTSINFTYNDAGNTISAALVDSYMNTLADARITAVKGVANGLATLDAQGRIPTSQLSVSVMEYQGTWNAATNTPTLANGTGSAGDLYRVTTAGSQNLGSGAISYEVGDYVIYNGTTWEKSDTTDAVASVNGQTGTVTLTTTDISEGTNQYFTSARVLGTSLNGYTVGTNTAIATADTVLGALQKLQGQLNNKQASGNYQPLDADLTSIAGLAGTTGLLKKTAADTWTLDTSTYLTGNQSITLSGDVTGSGATAITTAISAATVTGKALTGYTLGGISAIAATDTILAAFGKVQAQINAKQNSITTGTTAQYFKGDLSLGTLDTTAVVENGNLYFTNARAIGATITGYTVGANSALAATDTVLAAFGKVQAQLNAKQATITTGTTAQYLRGDLSLGTLNTTAVVEGTNLYHTDARSIAAPLAGLSTATAIAVTSSDSVLVGIGKLQAQVNAQPLETKGNSALAAGTNTIISLAKSTYKSVRVHYVVYNGTHQHSANVIVTNDGVNTPKVVEYQTDTIGTASAVITATAAVGASNLDIKIQGVPDATYSVKFNYDYM